MKAEAASFRDPAGRIYYYQGRVLRTISNDAVGTFDAVQQNETLRRLVTDEKIVSSVPVDDVEPPFGLEGVARVVEHPSLPFVSYPYEWSFSLLKAAALHHLDLQLALLPSGVSLSDATSYNVQFNGPRPIFIDALSFTQYSEGDYWLAHRQFCEQFLNPLLLHALVGVPHNDLFRGSLEGLPATTLAELIPFSKKLSWNLQTHVLAPARMQNRGDATADKAKAATRKPLPRNAYLGLLDQLRRWIAKLEVKGMSDTVWGDYEKNNSYCPKEADAKTRAIKEFARTYKPQLMADLGCNSGAYSEAALDGGASKVIGFDADHGALEAAYARAVDRKLDFLPLFQDAANPSPGQGWNGEERASFIDRCNKVDGLVALAFVHHIAIGRNVPLDKFVDWLCAIAPRGVVEFVPKEDPMVGALLRLRKDIFPDYTLENFERLIARHAKVVKSERVTETGRVLVTFERENG